MKLNHESSGPTGPSDPSDLPGSNPMDGLLDKLSNQQTIHNQGGASLKNPEDDDTYIPTLAQVSTSNSVPITPATENFGSTAPTTRPASAALNDEAPSNEEVLRLKLELARAQNQISRLDQELTQTRQPGAMSASASPVDPNFPSGFRVPSNPSRVPSGASTLINAGSQQAMGRDTGPPWGGFDDSRSDASEAMSATGFNRGRNIWGGGNKSGQGSFMQGSFAGSGAGSGTGSEGPWGGRAVSQGYADQNAAYEPSVAGSYRGDRLTPDYDMTIRPAGGRRNNRFDSRLSTPAYGAQSSYSGSYYGNSQYGGSDHGITGPSQGPAGPGMYSNYHPSPVGTPLSPLATEFTSSGGGGPWKSEVSAYLCIPC